MTLVAEFEGCGSNNCIRVVNSFSSTVFEGYTRWLPCHRHSRDSAQSFAVLRLCLQKSHGAGASASHSGRWQLFHFSNTSTHFRFRRAICCFFVADSPPSFPVPFNTLLAAVLCEWLKVSSSFLWPWALDGLSCLPLAEPRRCVRCWATFVQTRPTVKSRTKLTRISPDFVRSSHSVFFELQRR